MAKTKAGKPGGTAEKPAQVIKSRTISGPSEADIRMRAFQIYLDRRGRPGTPEADWLQAERELKQNGATTRVG